MGRKSESSPDCDGRRLLERGDVHTCVIHGVTQRVSVGQTHGTSGRMVLSVSTYSC